MLALSAAGTGAVRAQTPAHASATAAGRLDVRPQICEIGETGESCHLEFSIHPGQNAPSLCLIMEAEARQTMICAQRAERWSYEATLELKQATRFLLVDPVTGAIVAEARVDLASYLPEVRPRRRHGWFSL